MKSELKLGKEYADMLLKRCGLGLDAELMGEESTVSLVIDNQAVIYREAGGGLHLQIYPIQLAMLQIKRMFGMATEEDMKPPAPNIVPIDDIYDGVRRAVQGIVDLRVKLVAAELADLDSFRTATDVVSKIPQAARKVEEAPTLQLALPEYDDRNIPETMKTYLGKWDWAGFLPVFNTRSKISVLNNGYDGSFVGERRSSDKFFLSAGALPVRTGQALTSINLTLFMRGIAKKSEDGWYEVWFFDFRAGREHVWRFDDVNQENFDYYFAWELNDETLVPLDAKTVSREGWSFRSDSARTSAISLVHLTQPDFSDAKLKLPTRFRTRFKTGEGLDITVQATKINRWTRIALLPLDGGLLMRVLVSDYLRAVEVAGRVVDLPVRVWDRKTTWRDESVRVTLTDRGVIEFNSDHPEIDKMFGGMGLYRDIRAVLPNLPRVKNAETDRLSD